MINLLNFSCVKVNVFQIKFPPMNAKTTFPEARPTKKDEGSRIQALMKYALLDTPPEKNFDELTRLAATALKTPFATISLVDKDRIWFKSQYGFDVKQVGRDPGFCASAVLGEGIYEVEDAQTDPRTKDNPLVNGDFNLRFYAGHPLRSSSGHNIGMLCVLDTRPRKLSETDKKTLKSLARMVEHQIEARYDAKMTTYNHNHALSVFAHDLKNPLATINMAAEIIEKKKNDPKAIAKMCTHISTAGKNSLRLIEDMLQSSKVTFEHLNLTAFPLSDLVKEVVKTNRLIAQRKNQNIKLFMETECEIRADEGKLSEVIDNLINNAIKYSESQKEIVVRLWKNEKNVVLEVKDQGPGLTAEDKKNLFGRFSTLSAKPTNGENSTGLGLFIVHELVKAHKGSIRAESGGKGKGTVFVVELPINQ